VVPIFFWQLSFWGCNRQIWKIIPIKSRSTDANKVNTPTNTHYFHLYQCHWQNGYLLWCIIPLIVSNSQLKMNHHQILVCWLPCLCAPVVRTCGDGFVVTCVPVPFLDSVPRCLGMELTGERTLHEPLPCYRYIDTYTHFYDWSIKQYLNLMRKKIMQVATTKYRKYCIYF
jgi:hypothetical protein